MAQLINEFQLTIEEQALIIANLERTVDELLSSRLTKFISKINGKKKIAIRVEVKDGSFHFKQI